MSQINNPLIFTDKELEDLETRLRIFPDLQLDPSVSRKLLDTAMRARQALASLSVDTGRRSIEHNSALINYGLGEVCHEQ